MPPRPPQTANTPPRSPSDPSGLPDDLFVVSVDQTRPERAPRPCGHPRDKRVVELVAGERRTMCSRCNHVFDPERQRKGRNANRRGRRIQKANMEAAGLTNLPGNIPGLDGTGGMFRGESKSGGMFPERLYRVLKAIPVAPGQVPILVVADNPGQGRKRRAVVVVELSDWRALHGDDATGE